jgi:apolipoprotein N-acyltransferase
MQEQLPAALRPLLMGSRQGPRARDGAAADLPTERPPRAPGATLKRLSPLWLDALALLAGALTPLGFAPLALAPLAILAPAVLFALWREPGMSPSRAVWRGFLFGFGMFGVGVSWVFVSLHNFGNMPVPLATLAVVLLCAFLALYPAALGWLQARFPRVSPALRFIVVLPALWTLLEWLRGWMLSGFPWLNLGYSQIDTPLAGLAPWLGVYGVSLATAMSAGLLAAAWRDRSMLWKRYAPAFAGLWVLGWLAGLPQWVAPAGPPLRVALVQGNVALAQKWNPLRREAILENYFALTERAHDAQVVIWPEAAIPTYLDRLDASYLARLRELVRSRNVDVLVGAIEKELVNKKVEVFNSVVRIGAGGGSYRKRHLVPFGEFMPLPFLFQWFIDHFDIPMSDFSRGPAQQPLLSVAGHKVGVSVCYEDAFGEEVIAALPQATLLVNVSEDAWFGDSLAPHQRLQMARLRARESGRAMLRAANTGPSAVIDHRGALVARSRQFAIETLATSVQPMQGATPYVRVGNTVVVVLLVGLLAAAAWVSRRRGPG